MILANTSDELIKGFKRHGLKFPNPPYDYKQNYPQRNFVKWTKMAGGLFQGETINGKPSGRGVLLIPDESI